ncbi:FG-GAP repeat domain-containing protein [Micromonospora sp. CA-240977]|uniref:FG-GAP repeat domain-containing protein n=1 Tax=Micromonospora sp. CA-240977 TaxID=3239957 RepID=UPI003D90F0B6
MKILNAPIRYVTALAVGAAFLSTGAVPASAAEPTPTIPPAFASAAVAYPTAPCDPNGTTGADSTMATQLNAQLRSDMRGYMNAYRTSCARMVVNAVKARGLTSRAAVIAIATVIVETHLQNVDEELDHDSLGLFQQRASWGSAAERLNPTWATNAFLGKMLREYPNNSWKTAPIGEVCQAVQVSAYPDRYQTQAADAQIIVDALWTPPAPELPDMFGVSGDFSGDGKADIIARSGSGDLWLYPGTGNATTDAVVSLPRIRVGVDWDNMTTLVSSDFTNDGKADLVARDADGELWLYPGTGTATSDAVVKPRTRIGTGWNTLATITAGDFTNDGKADLVARDADGILWLYKGTGTATSDAVVTLPRVRVGTDWQNMNGLTTGDFTNDGKDDLVARHATGELWLYPGTGIAATDGVVKPRTRIGTGWSTLNAITAGDFTNDGKADIAARETDGELWLYPGTGTATTDAVVKTRTRIGTDWQFMTAIS